MSSGSIPKPFSGAKLFGDIDDPENPAPWFRNLSCDIDKSASVLTGMFTELTQLFWSEGSDFLDPLPRQLRWNPDPVTTAIAIDSEYNFSDQYKNPPQLIGIKLGTLTHTRTSGTTPSGAIKSNIDSSETAYSETTTGTVMLRHVGTSAAQSLMMGDKTAELFRAFAPVVRSELNFSELRVSGRVPVSEQPVKWYGCERYTSDVTLTFVFETVWVMKRESPKLRNIFFNTGQRARDRVIIPPVSENRRSD